MRTSSSGEWMVPLTTTALASCVTRADLGRAVLAQKNDPIKTAIAKTAMPYRKTTGEENRAVRRSPLEGSGSAATVWPTTFSTTMALSIAGGFAANATGSGRGAGGAASRRWTNGGI